MDCAIPHHINIVIPFILSSYDKVYCYPIQKEYERVLMLKSLTENCHPFGSSHVVLKGGYFTCIVARHFCGRHSKKQSAMSIPLVFSFYIVQINPALHISNTLETKMSDIQSLTIVHIQDIRMIANPWF